MILSGADTLITIIRITDLLIMDIIQDIHIMDTHMDLDIILVIIHIITILIIDFLIAVEIITDHTLVTAKEIVITQAREDLTVTSEEEHKIFRILNALLQREEAPLHQILV